MIITATLISTKANDYSCHSYLKKLMIIPATLISTQANDSGVHFQVPFSKTYFNPIPQPKPSFCKWSPFFRLSYDNFCTNFVHRLPGHSRGLKQPRRSVNNPPHLAQRLKKEESCISTPPLCLHGRS